MILRATQLLVPLPNKPGTLANLCSVLGKAQVNIVGISAQESKGEGVVRVLIDDAPAAKTALREAKIRYSEEEVLDVELDNRPGAFGELLGKLAKANINVNHTYATTAPFARARVVIAVPDAAKALSVLGG